MDPRELSAIYRRPIPSRPLRCGAVDVAGLHGFRVEPAKPSLSESFGQAIQLPIVIAYAKVCIAGMVGVCGLGAVIVALGVLS